MQIENIQNRVRNTLGPIQFLVDICELLENSKPDTKIFNQAMDILRKNKPSERCTKAINKLIVLAKASDMKINDDKFDIEDFIMQHNL